MNRLYTLSVFIIFIGFVSGCASPMSQPGAAESLNTIEVQAHRGGRGHRPENTLESFRWSHALGNVVWEMDVAVTSDGIPVLSHDPYLRGVLITDAKGNPLKEVFRIADLTLDDLKSFRTGPADRHTRYGARFPNQTGAYEAIPTLEEVFALSAELGGGHRFNIEIKTFPSHPNWTKHWEEVVDSILAVVEESGMKTHVVIQSFDWRTLGRTRIAAPEIAIACLTVENFSHKGKTYNLRRGEPGPSPWLAGFDVDDFNTTADLVRAFGADIYSPYYKELDAVEIAAARAAGLLVLPWTVNDPDDMARLLEAGVDGIITDYPDRLLEILMR